MNKLIRLIEKASKGEFEAETMFGETYVTMSGNGRLSMCKMPYRENALDDAKLIAHLLNLAPVIPELVALLERYRNKTPMGHQPHMIVGDVDEALRKYKEAEG